MASWGPGWTTKEKGKSIWGADSQSPKPSLLIFICSIHPLFCLPLLYFIFLLSVLSFPLSAPRTDLTAVPKAGRSQETPSSHLGVASECQTLAPRLGC